MVWHRPSSLCIGVEGWDVLINNSDSVPEVLVWTFAVVLRFPGMPIMIRLCMVFDKPASVEYHDNVGH